MPLSTTTKSRNNQTRRAQVYAIRIRKLTDKDQTVALHRSAQHESDNGLTQVSTARIRQWTDTGQHNTDQTMDWHRSAQHGSDNGPKTALYESVRMQLCAESEAVKWQWGNIEESQQRIRSAQLGQAERVLKRSRTKYDPWRKRWHGDHSYPIVVRGRGGPRNIFGAVLDGNQNNL